MTKKTKIWILLILLAGLMVLSYPQLSDFLNRRNGSWVMEQVQTVTRQTPPEQLRQQRSQAQRYNAALLAGETPQNYGEILNVSQGIMGYLQIPSIDVSLPIYHGVTEEVLQKGVGHLPESAFPIGGINNHAVLTGHTGLPSAELLTDLTLLREEDLFSIRILGEDITYRVDQIRVVLPEETEELQPVAGEDYCTLVTCTPYGINSHRLLVRGKRVYMSQQQLRTAIPETPKVTLPPGLVVALIAAVSLIGLMLLVILQKKKEDEHG